MGFEDSDTDKEIVRMAKKIVNMRIFDDDKGVMNRSVLEIGGEILIVSQFTLYASTKKGNRPSYIHAAKPDIAIPLYESFCKEVEMQLGREVKTGIFGADMKVYLLNDGPSTLSTTGSRPSTSTYPGARRSLTFSTGWEGVRTPPAGPPPPPAGRAAPRTGDRKSTR